MRRLATVPILGLAERAGMTVTVSRPTVVVGPPTPGELRTARRLRTRRVHVYKGRETGTPR